MNAGAVTTQPPERRWRLRTAGLLLIVALLAVLLPPLVNLNRYRADVAAAIGRAVDRQVTVGEVSLRLVPRPGFHLQRVVIEDDPTISAEPMLSAPEVTAVLRLGSLWRGRLEIGRLSFYYPSVNLARSPDGRWNLESLLARASAATPATSDPRSVLPDRFPYIEAQDGRINLKLGDEKQVYALNYADFSLWQSGTGHWGVRLHAVPVRTDTVISDTGILRMNGSLLRAAPQEDAQVRLRLQWEGAQLGQVTRLLDGRDRGWRGAVSADATVAGTPGDLALAWSASVSEFRRYDIAPADSMSLEARCTAAYSSAGRRLADLECRMPLGDGVLAAGGVITSPAATPGYDLTFTAQRVPMEALAALARRARRDLPEDLAAAGRLDAEFRLQRAPGAPRQAAVWQGEGTLTGVELRSRLLRPPLRVANARFVLAEGAARGGTPAGPHIAMHPFALPLGGRHAATADGWFSAGAFALTVQGEAEVGRALAAARALGLSAANLPATGLARLHVRVTGAWADFPSPAVTGSARLRDVQGRVPGIALPLWFTAGTLLLAPATATLRDLAVSPQGSETEFQGWVRVPRGCGSLSTCAVQFELRANHVSSAELNALLNPSLLPRPWYRFIRTRRGAASPLAVLRASGRLSAERAVIGGLEATDVAARVEIAGGMVTFPRVQATVFGGRHLGHWRADFTGSRPAYSGKGTVENASMPLLAGAARRHWSGGTVDATYELTASGWSMDHLLPSSQGTLRIDWQDGVLHPAAAKSGAEDVAEDAEDQTRPPLRVRRFRATLDVAGGLLQLSDGDLVAADGRYRVTGSARFDRSLSLRLVRDAGHAYSLSGTLAEPQVTALSPEQIQAAARKE